jgi:glycosyltransferase involved in cell wall biosynthesis
VLVCHAAKGFTEAPFYFPRIMRYVAVDHRCRARFAHHPQIPAHRIEVILNAVDLERFRPRGPLPSQPKRAVVFSNNASRFTHLPAVREVCRRMGLELEVLGRRQGKPVHDPENFLPRYDIVFAKARCALEAMAVGNAVVLCDVAGAGPLVTTKNFDKLRPMNFGAGVLVNPISPDFLQAQLAGYDPQDAMLVSACVRGEASLKNAALQWLDLYSSVISEFDRSGENSDAEAAAAQAYFQQWTREKALEWTKAQFRRIRSIPLVGTGLHHLGRRLAREWTSNPEL